MKVDEPHIQETGSYSSVSQDPETRTQFPTLGWANNQKLMLKKEQAHLWTTYIKNNKTWGLDQRFPYEILKEEIGADTYH